MELFVITPSLIALYELFTEKILCVGDDFNFKLEEIEHKIKVTQPVRDTASLIKQQFAIHAAAMQASEGLSKQ